MIFNIDRIGDSLYGARSFLIINNEEVTRKNWNDFFQEQEAFFRIPGLSGMFYAEVFTDDLSLEAINQRISEQNSSIDAVEQTTGTKKVIVLHASSTQSSVINSTEGEDIYQNSDKKAAIDQSAQTKKITTTEPLMLTSDTQGIILFLPLVSSRANDVQGFIAASVQTNRLFEASFNSLNDDIGIKITDVTDPKEKSLVYRSTNWSDNQSLERYDIITAAGRQWKINYSTPLENFQDPLLGLLPFSILMIGLLASGLITAKTLSRENCDRKNRT